MPSSRPTTIPVVLHLLRQLRPKSILDVGIGFGKWGHLFREYTDINEAERDPARYQREHWQVRIDGIEGHAPYVTEMHRYLYHDIHIGDAARILPTLGTYDLVFLGDIIEHFDKAAGTSLLDLALAHAGKAVIVSTPKFETDQEDLCGNELERHRSLWSVDDFKAWPTARVRTIGGDTLVAALTRPGQKPLSFEPGPKASPEAGERMRLARAELLSHLQSHTPFLLVDEEQLRPSLPLRGAKPFLECPDQPGLYWGPPADGQAAVAELRRQHAAGHRIIAFTWATFWWLDHYPELRDCLAAEWRCTVDSPALKIFESR